EMRGRNFHAYSFERVLADIRDARDRGARSLFIVDDNITLNVRTVWRGGKPWVRRDGLLPFRWTRISIGRWSRSLDRAPNRRTVWSGPALFWPISTSLRHLGPAASSCWTILSSRMPPPPFTRPRRFFTAVWDGLRGAYWKS